LIKFKIVSGYYQDITYELEKEYDFTNLKKYDVELYKAEEPYLDIKIYDTLRAKYVGLSLVDRNPIFLITKDLIRYSKLETLLKEK
jgi:hypothetical protein